MERTNEGAGESIATGMTTDRPRRGRARSRPALGNGPISDAPKRRVWTTNSNASSASSSARRASSSRRLSGGVLRGEDGSLAGDGSGAEQYDLPTDDEGAPGSSVADTLSAGPSPSTPRDDRRVSRAATPDCEGCAEDVREGVRRDLVNGGDRRNSPKGVSPRHLHTTP